MTLSREFVIPGTLAEYQSFAELIRGLSDDEWSTAGRCDGWTNADVAAHVVGQLTDVVNLRLDGLGTAEVTKRQADERRGRSPIELADELESSFKVANDLLSVFDDEAWAGPPPGATVGTLGFGIESMWFDTFLHADDIRSSLGASRLTGDGLRPSLSHIAQVLTDQKWGPAELTLTGVDTFPVSGGNGNAITGDPGEFILASTGRGNPALFGLDETVNIYR